MRLVSRHRYGQAVLFLRVHLREYPEDAWMWLELGELLTSLGRYEEAEQALAKAIDFYEPERRWVAYLQLGCLFRASGDYPQAVKWFQRAVDGNPNDATPRIYLGAVLAKSGRFTEAEEAHLSATQCAEGCIDEACLNIGFVLRAREQFAEAASWFRRALQITPDYREAKSALRDVRQCLKWKRLSRR
jgi:Flp pilus assembly protein TadD